MSAKVSKYLIYALVDPRTKEWRYIGKSSSGLRRAKAHCWPSDLIKMRRTYSAHWVKSLIKLGLNYEILILEEFENNEKLAEAEMEWIAEARRVGICLTNHTDGGEGSVGYVTTLETKAKLSLANMGKQFSEERKANISLATTGRSLSEEHKIKLSVAKIGKPGTNKGKKFSNEHRKNMALGQKSKPFVDSFGNTYSSTKACARALGCARSSVTSVLKGKRPTCRGRTFKYL